jgi:hypothetical protein
MVTLPKCILVASAAAILAAADSVPETRPKFFADDPVLREAGLHRVGDVRTRSIDELFDFLYQTFATPRMAVADRRAGSAGESSDVNTLGEVPDGSWYQNRHYAHGMTLEELRRGPGNEMAPRGTLVVTGAKSDGVTPGFTIRDEAGRHYLLKFDPPDYPEISSAADAIGSKILYALGYYTPENHIVSFRPESLAVAPDATYRAASGRKEMLTKSRIHRLLRDQPRDKEGQVRALASLWVPGKTIGPLKYQGTRTDDPNDIVPHEDLRELRGLAVFAAWINHTDAKAINSLDTIIESDGQRFIRHYLIDFGSSLGSDAGFPKLASRGHVYDIEPEDMLRQVAGLGIYTPSWQRAHTPDLRGVGRFEAASFEPQSWKPDYPNPAFLRLTEADAFWAARQVAAFSDAEIHALVETGELSDPRATDYIASVLAARRDKISAAYLSSHLAIDRFRVADGCLQFDDLRSEPSGVYDITWAAYDNNTGISQAWEGRAGASIPQTARQIPVNGYIAATIRDRAVPDERVNVYLRRTANGWTIVGVDRDFQQELAIVKAKA